MPATIEVFSKPLTGLASGPEHMYIIYTNEAGVKNILRGGPEGSTLTNAIIGDISVEDLPYAQFKPDGSPQLDWDEHNTHISQQIFTGTDAEMYAKIELARTEMTRINNEGYDYNLPFVDTLVAGWGGANDQNSNTVVTRLADVMGLKPLVLNFIETKQISVPGYDATFEHSTFERTTESLYQGLKAAGHTVSELWNSTKDFVGNIYEGVQDFFFGLFAREGEVIVGPLEHIDNSLLDFTSTISSTSHNATANPDDFTTGSALSGGDYSANMPVDTINGDGLDNTSLSQIVTDNYRPGAQTLADNNLNNILDRATNFINQNVIQPIADIASSIWGGIQSTFASLTNLFTQAPQVQNVDPLILDLKKQYC